MIKPNELRIGNLVYNDYLKKNKYVTGIFDNNIWLSDNIDEDSDQRASIEACQPIPLTEEWLLKFGFEEKQGYSTSKYWKDDKFLYKLNGYFLVINETYEGEALSDNIQYVHQLQNLYFALTGEELEIKKL